MEVNIVFLYVKNRDLLFDIEQFFFLGDNFKFNYEQNGVNKKFNFHKTVQTVGREFIKLIIIIRIPAVNAATKN